MALFAFRGPQDAFWRVPKFMEESCGDTPLAASGAPTTSAQKADVERYEKVRMSKSPVRRSRCRP